MLGFSFFFKLDWSSYTGNWKLEPLFAQWSFFPLRLFFIAINLPYQIVVNTVNMSVPVLQIATWLYWKSPGKVFVTLSAIAGSLEPVALPQSLAIVSFFCRYCFRRYSSKLAEWSHFLFLVRGPLVFVIGCIIFLVTIPRYYMHAYAKSFFHAQLGSRLFCQQDIFFWRRIWMILASLD